MEESSTDSALQGFHSSDSLSLPSEPPDIRNWFSSYKYESFVLDTCDDVFGTKARETRNESEGYAPADEADNVRANDDGDSSEPLKSEEEEEEERTFSEVPDSSYSQPGLNEPHHPDNWLSTFVPETCGLDLDDDEEFETAPSEGKVDVFSKKGIEKNLENSKSKFRDLGTPPERVCSDEFFMNECSPSQEVPADSSYSQSVLHEPHHPENWLSTCIPETCGLDLEEDEFSQAKKDAFAENSNSKCSSDLDALEKPSSEERHSQKENSVAYSQISILSEPPDIKNWFSSYAYESPMLEEEINNGLVESESKEDGELNPQSIDKEPSTKPTPDKAGSTEVPSSISGFVTTRKNKTAKRPNHNENSCPGSRQHVASKCLKSERLVISSSRNRSVLSERTNLVLQPEVTGKWKCPQRNKPVREPPLKQLRLERWVTKL